MLIRLIKFHANWDFLLLFRRYTYSQRVINISIVKKRLPYCMGKPPQFWWMHEILGCFGSELQLINIYASLCDPAKASEWNELTLKYGIHLNFEEGIEKKLVIGGRGLEPNYRTLDIINWSSYASNRFMAFRQVFY